MLAAIGAVIVKFFAAIKGLILLLPKVKLEIVLPDALAENAVATILKTAKTGKIGDGKIFLSKIDEAVRVRNGDRGDTAL